MEGWITLEASARPDPDGAGAVRDRQRAFAAALRADDSGPARLGTMFGKAWADEYAGRVLHA